MVRRVAEAGNPTRMVGESGLAVGMRPGELAELEELRRRNSELELEAAEARAREEEARRELERTRERLRAMEEAEERLSVELGEAEAEAEAAAQARAYHLRIKALSDQLAVAHDILTSTGFHCSLVALNRPN